MPTEELIVRKLVDGEWATVVDEQITNGGGAGAAVVRGPFEFAFDTPGLTNGVTVYTPTVADVLLDAWIEVDTAFDGTTPRADLGTFVGTNSGFFASDFGPLFLANADDESSGTGVQRGAASNGVNLSLAEASSDATQRIVPAKFTATNPLKLVVSQDGQKGGAAIGGAAGAGKVFIVTATPVSL